MSTRATGEVAPEAIPVEYAVVWDTEHKPDETFYERWLVRLLFRSRPPEWMKPAAAVSVSPRFCRPAQPAPEPSDEQQPDVRDLIDEIEAALDNARHDRMHTIVLSDLQAEDVLAALRAPEPQQEQPKPVAWLVEFLGAAGKWLRSTVSLQRRDADEEFAALVESGFVARIVPLYASPPPAAIEQTEADTVREMRVMLHNCAEWFQAYADIHRAKGAEVKATANQQRADQCRDVLARALTAIAQPREQEREVHGRLAVIDRRMDRITIDVDEGELRRLKVFGSLDQVPVTLLLRPSQPEPKP